MMKLSVAAVTATYNRTVVLERLLDSLAEIGPELSAIIVVDNAGSKETEALVKKAGPKAHYVNPGTNLGCGGGLALGEQCALEIGGADLTHILILDDDVVIPPDTVHVLAETMETEGADLACPLVVTSENIVGWYPMMPDFSRRMRHRAICPPEVFRERFGSAPRKFIVAMGICLLVTRRAIVEWGRHRSDFWVRGEDIEFSRRLTVHGKGILVPTLTVQHLPPAYGSGSESSEAEYLKHLALVQNMALIGLRLPHGRRLAWTVPMVLKHFFKTWPWSRFPDAIRAVWRGAILGHPAGAGSGQTFYARFAALTRARS